MINWLKRKFAIISMALSNVEKNALSQSHEHLPDGANKFQRQNQGRLSDALVNGEVTEEVQNLRWRTYKILKASEQIKTKIIGYDDDGLPITNSVKINNKRGLKKVQIDEYDSYPLEMVISNDEIVIGTNEMLNNQYLSTTDEPTINYSDDGEEISASHGEMNQVEFFTTNKSEVPIKIIRDTVPNYYLESYTRKLNVRQINETDRLLEFYVSKYPDEYSLTNKLFVNLIKKNMETFSNPTSYDFNSVEFVSYKSIGVDDFLEFKYDIVSYDKTIEFNGHYVIKFIAKVVINGVDILEKHKVDALDKKYENKTKK